MESLSLPFQRGQDSTVLQVESNVVRKGPRRKREFTPEERKDALYWEKRRKNNEAAKRSREKRRLNDYALETQLMALKEENARLSAELMAIKLHFGMTNPVAFTGRQSNQLQHHSHSSAQPSAATSAYHQSLQRNYHWGGRDSIIPNHQSSHPFLVPAYALHTMRGYSYLNASGPAGSGIVSPLILSRNLLPTYSSGPGAPLLKPIPTRAASDEEEEQQVPRLLYCSAAQRQTIPTRKDKKLSPHR
ncbi:nuclear factor, interleukin 3 regulated, member 4 [Kryptolebias marmoratus]|uniref:nuclear factor, interleukin 3 regulated, member 4 n=1 Tax=Kryptolebias marmoratus TaxID=37003 RepID=UPI000D530C27|nr:nuclear factor, interleukin 3 regulated, member 4 [Kryptolebias marmoratus]XP_037829990.1 nuclear factor, interleukin 3 regulated, member 4 [Kryptolebias marmoratus]